MEPRLPDYVPQYQKQLDAEYNNLTKRQQAELSEYAKNSLYPPKDGVPWSEKYAAMVKRHNQELADHMAKEALNKKTKDIIHGETKIEDVTPVVEQETNQEKSVPQVLDTLDEIFKKKKNRSFKL